MTRPAKVIIDHVALHHNFSLVRKFAPEQKIMAIVKADAYGHGLLRIARALTAADAFGVACLEEAEQLRQGGIVDHPIILLEGPYASQELIQIQQLNLDVVIHHNRQIEMLESSKLESPVNVWIKIDTGMHRLGFDPNDFPQLWQRLKQCPSVKPAIRLMSHLAIANDRTNPMTAQQLQTFVKVCKGIDAEKSLANSAAIIGWPETHADWIRPGLMLYGISPMDNTSADKYGLRAVMTLKSELISVKNLKQGDAVGYGASWRCPEDMTIGVVATGYGDGFPRHAASGAPVLVNGQRTCVIGYASMDMLTVDLRTQPHANVGDPVEFWGENLPIEEVAKFANTVPYELLCGVHKRLTFIDSGKD